MKNQKGFTVNELLIVLAMGFVLLSYCVNAYKFFRCDFASPYKAEVVYGIGVFAVPTFIITAWIDVGK